MQIFCMVIVSFFLGGLLGLLMLRPFLVVFGFTSNGIRRHSLASHWQKVCGNVQRRKAITYCQSIGKSGLSIRHGVKIFLVCGTVLASIVAIFLMVDGSVYFLAKAMKKIQKARQAHQQATPLRQKSYI